MSTHNNNKGIEVWFFYVEDTCAGKNLTNNSKCKKHDKKKEKDPQKCFLK